MGLIHDIENYIPVNEQEENDKKIMLDYMQKNSDYLLRENGVGHFYNHWNISLEIFKKYKDNFGLSSDEIILITNLIFYHDINIEKAS